MLNLLKKTGFRILNEPVIIVDSRGVVFYDSSFVKKKVGNFNLPKGNYRVSTGNISFLKKPVKYKLHPLPPKQRRYPSPRSFKILYRKNPNKCSVLWDKKVIIFDISFLNTPRYVNDFILFHEFGHQFYNTELFADLWAGNMMKVKGYNPSQIGMAPIISLSQFQQKRKNVLVDNIIKNL